MSYKNYEIVKTDDGTETLYSKLYNESCHSNAGATEETKLHYLQGCEILKKSLRSKELNILEVGFGTGLGFLLTKDLLKNSLCKVTFISFEIDEELLDIFEKNNNLKFIKCDSVYSLEIDHITLKIFLGDARSTISNLKSENKLFHAIYQDAFSPRRNAHLWTVEWFKDLKDFSHPTCLMSTYSSSSSVRKSMIEAGWVLYEGHKFGQKRSSTRAKLNGVTDQEIINKLKRSPVPPLTDENCDEYTIDNRK